MNLLFPGMALGVGIFLYFRYPILYLGFTWWLWFLTPFVRRLSDYRSSYTDPSPILLAPFLVTLVSSITFWKSLPKVASQGGLPYIFSVAAIGYGFFVGLIYRPPVTVCLALLDWLAPLLFGFHLFTNWRNYPSYRQNIQRIFLWGVLVMGIYGVVQFLIAPEWDKYWLVQAEFSSGGKPEPLQLNVWSTMASNRPFSTVMMAGLLLLLVNPNKGTLGIPSTAAGYLSFLLAKKRTTWGSWFLGLFILTGSLKSNTQIRLLVTILVTVLCVVPLTTLEPFSTILSSRFESLSNIEEDNSAAARQEAYSLALNDALNSFLGSGIGGPSFDSGILSILLDLGWLGTIFYLSGILLLLFSLFQWSAIRTDKFASAARSIVFATFVQLPLGLPHIGEQGMILWGFLSLGMAAQKYSQFQRDSQKQFFLPVETYDIDYEK
ncbi:O-antigen ligase domain-containing protein [Zarconia navalis]|uniref:O-antigen ligase domain-containing protein n=1 Tax=Zarconia navalis TaxID=2992134 RepID=UPI0021F8AE03|nr:O-antigen ligase domain-containing protein [Zarconia navalis]